MAAFAGKIAEAIGCEGRVIRSGDAEDMRRALEMASDLATSAIERQALLEQFHKRAYALFTRPWVRKALFAVADALIVHEELTGAYVHGIIRGVKRSLRVVPKGELKS